MKRCGTFTVVFRPNPCVFACVRGTARQDEEKFRDRAREWRCIMKTTRSLELTLALLLSLLYSRERVFCKLLRDMRISYFVQVPFSHLLFTKLKKKGDFCSFHYDGRAEYVVLRRIVIVVVVIYDTLIIRCRFFLHATCMLIDESNFKRRLNEIFIIDIYKKKSLKDKMPLRLHFFLAFFTIQSFSFDDNYKSTKSRIFDKH